ncbi:penicillin-binding protein activator, partial [Salmonella enterica subsp. enterica serovar Kentucky]|nr:penicillin-binding protein activator [Salmonella enterica subsp. enterica serovar Kentucky]
AIIKPVVNNTGNVARLWINGIFCVLSICTTSVCESRPSINQPNNDYSLARMYAMGVDAWTLANHFSQMRQVQGFEINGNTGALTA